ncbi:HDOD domain-containing protein [Azomonas macrocytogenes]|uniref:HD-like signal output (HDOD) protein n=1 Tax=Azomonas macrocytogenes TaxID=69962 RepID=A0A839T4F1_AZOMA|nr:HDOD domain-containing protein [Azomonas macrocytogenes]MBB3104411.1 HD-like signal output (HDOD) protein [Azomonas macrocytogenes]
MSALVERLQQELIQAIENDELILPTLPEVALRVRETAEDPNISISMLSKVIGEDAALAARIIKIVNSPLMRSNKDINDLQAAISRLGMNSTCTLATGLAMEQMFQATSDTVDQKMREIWSRSTKIAAISHVLCRHYTRLMPDQATLAGLVHLIGVLPILTYAEEYSELMADPFGLERIINAIHPRIGEKILHTWQFSEPIASIPALHTDFSRNSANTKADYADIVQIATLYSYLGSTHPYALLDWKQIPAFAKLGIACETLREPDEELSATMEAAMSMFQ